MKKKFLFNDFSFLVILIETKEKKVTVMSAKPSSLPSYLATLPKPVPPKPLLPQQITYNDQFAQFLSSSKKVEPTLVSHTKPPALAMSSNVTAKVIVQPSRPPPLTFATSKPPPLAFPTIKPPPLAISINKPTQPIAVVNKSPATVTPAQRKQEEWTQMVLNQSQQAASTQKVRTERIQPYVQGQGQFYANPIQTNSGPFYTIMNSAPGAQPRVTVSNGQGHDRKNC